MRRLARDAIRGIERLLHPLRRRRARRELFALGASCSILVVCLGNICRSPYAGRRLDHEFATAGLGGTDVGSAGFILPGRTSPEAARRVAARRGLDLADHRSQVLTPSMLAAADLVLVMSVRQRRDLRREFGRENTRRCVVLGDLDPGPIDRRTIVDPYDQPDDVFEAVYERIDRCCRALVDGLATDRRRPKGSG